MEGAQPRVAPAFPGRSDSPLSAHSSGDELSVRSLSTKLAPLYSVQLRNWRDESRFRDCVLCTHSRIVFKFSRVRLVFRKSLSYLVSRFAWLKNSGKRSERRPGRNADSSLISKKMKRKIA